MASAVGSRSRAGKRAVMGIEYIPDWERRLERQDAFWHREIIDRPVVSIVLPKANPDWAGPKAKRWAGMREQWFDVAYRAECELARVMNCDWLGDALPYAWPDLGPEVLSAYFGCELEYGETTAWAIPNLVDWSDVETIRFSKDNPYWRKTIELLDVYLEVGRNKFYTNFTDLHGGGDAIAAFRDPERLCTDLIGSREEVKRLLTYVTDVYLWVLDFFHDKLSAEGQAVGTGGNAIQSSRRWHYVANDFSCMISKEMFDDVFLPGIKRECRHLEACYYHLDGEGALHHLDSLLDLAEINVVQWVYGAGNGPASKWMDVYKRCQAAGKGLQIFMEADEIDYFMENLKPEGLWVGLSGVKDREHGEALVRRLSTWN